MDAGHGVPRVRVRIRPRPVGAGVARRAGRGTDLPARDAARALARGDGEPGWPSALYGPLVFYEAAFLREALAAALCVGVLVPARHRAAARRGAASGARSCCSGRAGCCWARACCCVRTCWSSRWERPPGSGGRAARGRATLVFALALALPIAPVGVPEHLAQRPAGARVLERAVQLLRRQRAGRHRRRQGVVGLLRGGQGLGPARNGRPLPQGDREHRRASARLPEAAGAQGAALLLARGHAGQPERTDGPQDQPAARPRARRAERPARAGAGGPPARPAAVAAAEPLLRLLRPRTPLSIVAFFVVSRLQLPTVPVLALFAGIGRGCVARCAARGAPGRRRR